MNPEKFGWRLLLIHTLLLLSTALYTQAVTQDGSLSGLVVDQGGDPLPGVLITVTGPALPGEQKAVTDAGGRFRIPLLPVGRGYRVAVSLDGFQKVIQTDIEVNVGAEARADFTLALDTGSRYEITVVAETPMVDTQKSSISETVVNDFIDEIPNGRTYFAAMNMVPGVVATGFYDIRAHGASRFDNLFLVDGVDTTDSATGNFGMRVSLEAIQEVSMLTGGMEAEYGRATGAISNVVTKSGGNEFHGTVPIYYTNLDLKRHQERDRSAVEEESFYEVEPGISLGGPVVRDHLWFFVSYNNLTRRITGINDFDEEIERNEIYEQHLAKLSWQVGPNNKIVAQYFATPTTIDSKDALDPQIMRSAYSVREEGGSLAKLQWSSIFTPNLFLETRMAAHTVDISEVPAYADPGDDRFKDQQHGQGTITYGNIFSIWDEKHPRDLYSATLNYYRGGWAGEHNFKFGAEYQDFELGVDASYPDRYTINRPPDGQGNDRPDQLTITSDLHSYSRGDILTFFAQDSWNWDEKWTFNLGLRWETQNQENNLGERVYRLDNLIAPRAGIVWDPRGDGRGKVHLGYGRYFDAVGTLLGWQFIRLQNESWRYEGDYQTGQWEETSHTTPDDNLNQMDPNLAANYKDELTAGYEFQFFTDYSAAVRLYYSWQDNMIEDVFGNEAALRSGEETSPWYYWTNLPDARRKYRGLELQVR
jgi:outer membrane receptor for ferrienterochelin and colicin